MLSLKPPGKESVSLSFLTSIPIFLGSSSFLHLQSQQHSHFSLTLISSVATTLASPLLCTVKFLSVSLFYGYIRLHFRPTCISQGNLSILDLFSDLQEHAYNVDSHRFQEHTQDTDVLRGIIQSIISQNHPDLFYICKPLENNSTSPVSQTLKHLPTMWEIQV